MTITHFSIFGLGLMGGSIAKAIRANNNNAFITAYDVDQATLRQAQQEKIIDSIAIDLNSTAKQADIIIIATPVNSYEAIFTSLKTSAKIDALILDVGSIKTTVLQLAKKIIPERLKNFLPCHPLAGSEKSGWQAARANLLQNQLVVLTPDENVSQAAILATEKFWQSLDAKTTLLPAGEHDQLLACTSHLPQLLSYVFMNMVKQSEHYPDILKFTGGGFRDFTRLAESDPTLWETIVFANRDNILQELEKFNQQLQHLQSLLQHYDSKQLISLFQQAQAARLFYNDKKIN